MSTLMQTLEADSRRMEQRCERGATSPSDGRVTVIEAAGVKWTIGWEAYPQIAPGFRWVEWVQIGGKWFHVLDALAPALTTVIGKALNSKETRCTPTP